MLQPTPTEGRFAKKGVWYFTNDNQAAGTLDLGGIQIESASFPVFVLRSGISASVNTDWRFEDEYGAEYNISGVSIVRKLPGNTNVTNAVYMRLTLESA